MYKWRTVTDTRVVREFIIVRRMETACVKNALVVTAREFIASFEAHAS